MGFALAPTAIPEGYSLEAHDSVGSTNALALERATQDAADRLWVVSKRQQAGRGRRGRPWATEEGNLAASLLLVDPSPIASAATLGFVAGLSLADALQAVAPKARVGMAPDGGSAAEGRSRFALKWPNDVLADGGKLAGILLESTLLPDGRQAVVIGIGVNVVSAPSGLPYPATSLRDLGAEVDDDTIFGALSDEWVAAYELWNGGRNVSEVLRLWRGAAAGIGAEVAVSRDSGVVRGIFETIDDSGRLIVRANDNSRIAISAGDVHFGVTASVRA